MRKQTRAALWVMVLVAVTGVMVLPGCGGGGGGGSSDSLPGFLTIAGQVFFGNRTGGADTLSPFPAVPATGVPIPPGGTTTVPGAVFPTGGAGRQDYIQLSFNTILDASTVFSGAGVASGIVVTRSEFIGTTPTSVIQPFRLDLGGIVDPSNAAPTSGAAPPVLRLYYDPDGDLTTAQSLPAGAYTITVTNQLRAINGAPFCVTNTGSNCVVGNTYLPSISFVIGADVSDLTMAGNPATGVGASNITQGDPAVPIDREIQLNFSKAVAFDTLVGVANLTTLDPFITVPFTILAGGACAPPAGSFVTQIGNIHFHYRAPQEPGTGVIDPPSANLGIIVYMPDPLLNPAMVRIRFVDVTNLVGTQNIATSTFQNYASNRSKLPIPSSDPALGGSLLQLPPSIPVPGSGPTYNPAVGFADPARLEIGVVVESGTYGDPLGINCQANGGGAVDRVNIDPNVNPPATITPNSFTFNPQTPDYFLRFAFARGPLLARNPMPPDCVFVGRTQGNLVGIAALNTGGITTNAVGPGTNSQVPVAAGGVVTGIMSLAQNPLANPSVLGTPLDIEVGSWVIYQQLGAAIVNNSLDNPGRGPTTLVPGVPDTQNGTTPFGLLDLFGLMTGPPIQPWGNFVYVVDGDANSVKVLNGYNFQLITSLVGIPTPSGLGISPNLEFLYVSNFQSNSVTQVFSNPLAPQFHTVANVIQVGPGPTSITVQPANEDIFVCNFGGNSFSIIDRPSASERVSFGSGILGPTDIFATLRMAGIGLTNAYSAFITGRFSNNVVIYESDSPAVPENTIQGVVKGSMGGLSGPTRGSWNWQSYIGGTTGPGCFVANSTGGTVDEVILQNFTLSPPPGFPGPPGIRDYVINKQYQVTSVPGLGTSARPSDATIDVMSGKGVPQVGNNKAAADPAVGGGVPSVVLVSYPAAGIVAAFDYVSPIVRGSASIPGCDFLQAYYDQ